MTATRISRLLILLFLFACVVKCQHDESTNPTGVLLANGHWVGDGACLSVDDSGSNFVAGCGHGQFPKPLIRNDGTFDVDGTFRIEVGPISNNPPPPAHFSGSVNGSTLMLRVVPKSTPPPKTYVLTATTADGVCSVPCL